MFKHVLANIMTNVMLMQTNKTMQVFYVCLFELGFNRLFNIIQTYYDGTRMRHVIALLSQASFMNLGTVYRGPQPSISQANAQSLNQREGFVYVCI